MRSLCAATAILAITFTALAPTAGAQNDNTIVVDDFAASARGHTLTSTVPLRRGVTSKVTIVKDFIDLVSFSSVSISGGATIGSLSNGRTQNGQGMGFLAMNITVPSGQSPGSTITLRVGSGDVFTFKAVHRGQITTIGKNPDPATIPTGTPWTATIQGTDIGDVIVRPISCHAIAHSGRTANAVTATLTHNGACTTNAFGVALQGNSGNDPPSYPLTTGALAGFQFQYAPAGVACVSQPNIGQTTIRQPQINQVIQFRSGTLSPASVTISWDSLTAGPVAAPNNEWLVVRGTFPKSSNLTGPLIILVKGTSITQSFAVPGTHTVSVKPRNCSQTAPSASVTFSTRY